jgi:DNA-directed RNA polymerase subunit RPC12/RpoP
MQSIKQEVTCLSCERCGNIWQPRVEQPIKCPRCGHRFDSITIYKTKKVREAQPVKAEATQTRNSQPITEASSLD